MFSILAGGYSFLISDYLDDPHPAQMHLARARAEFGHALCQCVSPPRKLVIREVRSVLYLAVWPFDGHFHDSACEFHRELAEEHGDEKSASSQSISLTPSTSPIRLLSNGSWDVNIDIPKLRSIEQKVEPTALNTSSARKNAGKSTHRASMDLQQFFAWLWDSTSMARWGSGWRRDWLRVLRTVRTEAQVVTLRGTVLNDLLYIPPPFRKDREEEIHQEWARFSDSLNTGNPPLLPFGFMLIECKSLDKTEFGYKLHARNMAKPIFMDSKVYAAATKQSVLGTALLHRRKELKCAFLALVMVEGTGRGNVRAVNIAFMLTNHSYIPVATIYELELANKLCENDRTFTKGIGKHVGADFVLRDTTPPTAMLIYSLFYPDYVRQRDATLQQCEAAGCSTWKWEPGAAQSMPPLPHQTPR
jgi:Protein of unknown function (DUF1173)